MLWRQWYNNQQSLEGEDACIAITAHGTEALEGPQICDTDSEDNEGIALKTEEDDTNTTKPMRATKRLFASKVVPRALVKDKVDTDNKDNENCRENRRS